MIDVHTHILPNLDDGSKGAGESVAMLRSIRREGVDAVVATPHFYAKNESIEQFLIRREKSMAQLQERIWYYPNTKIPKVLLGAEVYYFVGISKAENLEQLTIEGTNILLLEMPFTTWNSEILREIEEIQRHRKLRVMIAHIERYLSIYGNRNYIEELLESDVLIQISTSALISWKTRRKMIQLIRLKYIHALGSDAHNMSSRKPDWDKTMPILRRAKIQMWIDKEIEYKGL